MFMPLVDWLAGLSLNLVISRFGYWIAFILLSLIGCKMIYESFKESNRRNIDPMNLTVLLFLLLATSIDDLAVGVSFAVLTISIMTPLIVIGIVTFLLAFLGVFIGHKSGHLFENKIEIVGGFILLASGITILIEHLFNNIA